MARLRGQAVGGVPGCGDGRLRREPPPQASVEDLQARHAHQQTPPTAWPTRVALAGSPAALEHLDDADAFVERAVAPGRQARGDRVGGD